MKTTFKQFLVETAQEDMTLVKIARILTDYIHHRRDYIRREFGKMNKDISANSRRIGTVRQLLKRHAPDDVETLLSVLPAGMGDVKVGIKTFAPDGLFSGNYNTIYMNSDFITSGRANIPDFNRVMVHELRHALDLHKSGLDGEVSYDRGRRIAGVEDTDFTKYQSSKSEINARYAEAINSLDQHLDSDFWRDGTHTTKDIYTLVSAKFKRYDISYLFPEKEKSKEYQRLIKRAVDYLQTRLDD